MNTCQRSSDIAHASRGFSYLWMLFAVAILGVGLSASCEFFQTGIKRQREAELIAIGHEFRTAIQRYYEAPGGGNQYPSSLQELVLDPRFPGVRRHLRKIHVDPVTGKAEWGLVRVAGRVVGVHSLSDAEPLKIANFEFVDAAFAGRRRYSEWVFAYPESGVPIAASGTMGHAAAAAPAAPAFPASASPTTGNEAGQANPFRPVQ